MPLSIDHTQDQIAAAAAQGNVHAGVRAIVTYLLSHGRSPTLRQALSLYRACSATPASIASIISDWQTTTQDQP